MFSNIYVSTLKVFTFYPAGGGSALAMVLDKVLCLGVLLIWIIVEQGPTGLAQGTGECCSDIIFVSNLSSLSLSLSLSLSWTARLRLKHCLNEPLSPKQSTKSTNLPVYSAEFTAALAVSSVTPIRLKSAENISQGFPLSSVCVYLIAVL